MPLVFNPWLCEFILSCLPNISRWDAIVFLRAHRMPSPGRPWVAWRHGVGVAGLAGLELRLPWRSSPSELEALGEILISVGPHGCLLLLVHVAAHVCLLQLAAVQALRGVEVDLLAFQEGHISFFPPPCRLRRTSILLRYRMHCFSVGGLKVWSTCAGAQPPRLLEIFVEMICLCLSPWPRGGSWQGIRLVEAHAKGVTCYTLGGSCPCQRLPGGACSHASLGAVRGPALELRIGEEAPEEDLQAREVQHLREGGPFSKMPQAAKLLQLHKKLDGFGRLNRIDCHATRHRVEVELPCQLLYAHPDLDLLQRQSSEVSVETVTEPDVRMVKHFELGRVWSGISVDDVNQSLQPSSAEAL
mmetsp:Transcript_81805/g.179762  ORF Transcript_81805/g.179762 Transcript_81805/m.179762 type:complete len:358 (-) Transcript_81805:871-1944(-)